MRGILTLFCSLFHPSSLRSSLWKQIFIFIIICPSCSPDVDLLLQEFSKLRITVHGSYGFTDFLPETASEMVVERVENCSTDCRTHTLNKWTCFYGVVAVVMAGRFYFGMDFQACRGYHAFCLRNYQLFFSPGATTPIGGCILQPFSGL